MKTPCNVGRGEGLQGAPGGSRGLQASKTIVHLARVWDPSFCHQKDTAVAFVLKLTPRIAQSLGRGVQKGCGVLRVRFWEA